MSGSHSASVPSAGRLDRVLVEAGLIRSRTLAAKAVEAGRVSVNGRTAAKASASVHAGDEVALSAPSEPEFVSRAGKKLHGALQALPEIRPEGLTCLDAGASTGGFTDVLLRAGARKVFAVDVGHGQLVDSLRKDPRVLVFEGLNIRHMEPEQIPGTPQLIVGDVSFISLTLLLGPLTDVLAPAGDMVLMIKPQFEVGRARVPSTGVIENPGHRRDGVRRVLEAAAGLGLVLESLHASVLPGQDGNLEFFAHWSKPRSAGDSAAGPDVHTADSLVSPEPADDFMIEAERLLEAFAARGGFESPST